MHTFERVSLFLKTRAVGLSALVLGAILLSFALPRTSAAFLSLSAPIAIFQLEQGRDVSPEQLLRAESDLEAALLHEVETAQLNNQLSYLALHRLLAEQPSNDTPEELRDTILTIESALMRRPLDAYLWTRYTHLNYLSDGLSPYTLAGLQRSFSYGSKETGLFEFRIILCFIEWARLPPSLKDAAERQIQFGAHDTHIWGRILAELPGSAAEELLAHLETAGADTQSAKRIAAGIRWRRENSS